MLITLLKSGTKVRVSSNDVRLITNISTENNTIWFDGPAFDPSQIGYPHQIQIESGFQFDQEYRNLLFEKAFAHPYLHKIPVAWGKSANTLKKKMSLAKSLTILLLLYMKRFRQIMVTKLLELIHS